MRRLTTIITLLGLFFSLLVPVRPSTPEYTDSAASRQLHWPNKTIKISLSTSLRNPGANIKLGSDVIGAARRALARWSGIGNLNFVVSESNLQSISPGASGDGISLVTIADTPQNNSIFGSGGMTGRTRIFYAQDTGEISEADVVINPHPVSPDGLPVQFSTDGTAGTYDLESTLTHEFGHLLGLDHSTIVSSTMHEAQALNGLYDRHAFTERTLSMEDRARLQAVYGTSDVAAVIKGQVVRGATHTPVEGMPVWVEDNSTGRLIAATATSTDGEYRIENLPARDYRVMTAQASVRVERSALPAKNGRNDAHGDKNSGLGEQVDLKRGEIHSVDLQVQNASTRFLNPRLLGTNFELSTMPIPAEAGKSLRVFVAGEGIDQVPVNGISFTSPFFRVLPGTLAVESFRTSYPVISFEVSVAPNAPFGDYTMRLQSLSGEMAYVKGAITIDPGVESTYANPTDDPRFFVRQHYQDFLGRDADLSGLDYWAGQLEQCGEDSACIRGRRISVATSFLTEPEFQRNGMFIHQLYSAVFGRRPSFTEFTTDRAQLNRNDEESIKAFVLALVQREEFLKNYPESLTGKELVDALLATVLRNSNVDLSVDASKFVALFDGSAQGRAAIIRRLAENDELKRAERDRSFVLMQYFGYLLRDPDEEGFNFWVNTLNKNANDPSRFSPVTCAFINSAEYQSRFGMSITHSESECR